MKINYDSIIDEEKLFNQNQIDGSVPVRPPVDELNIFIATDYILPESPRRYGIITRWGCEASGKSDFWRGRVTGNQGNS